MASIKDITGHWVLVSRMGARYGKPLRYNKTLVLVRRMRASYCMVEDIKGHLALVKGNQGMSWPGYRYNRELDINEGEGYVLAGLIIIIGHWVLVRRIRVYFLARLVD